MRRSLLAAVLLAAALMPGHAFGQSSAGCTRNCDGPGAALWTRPLPGSWMAQGGIGGTVPVHGQAYAAAGTTMAVVGFGTTVAAFGARTGIPLWTTAIRGFPAGALLEAIRVWNGAVTAGVSYPHGRSGSARAEVVLSARTGHQVRRYPAAAYGGAVAASAAATVIIGPASVTSYSNRTGKATWRRPTGRVAQAWRTDGGAVYVTVASGGYLSTAPVTALRRISLRTGAERLVRPPGGAFAGSLAGAFGGAVLFSGPAGLTAYSEDSGRRLWRLPSALPAGVDDVSGTLYVTAGNALTGVEPQTGERVARLTLPGSAGLYGIRNGIALGLDLGAHGDVWGYEVAARHVIWTTGPLPWPHFFVDLSAIGGSADPASDTILLTTCGELGATDGTRQACQRPELVAVGR